MTTYEQKKAQAMVILRRLHAPFITPDEALKELESIGMVFLDDEQELPQYFMHSYEKSVVQQDMLKAGFKKVLEAGK
jgi:hypothetical protein